VSVAVLAKLDPHTVFSTVDPPLGATPRIIGTTPPPGYVKLLLTLPPSGFVTFTDTVPLPAGGWNTMNCVPPCQDDTTVPPTRTFAPVWNPDPTIVYNKLAVLECEMVEMVGVAAKAREGRKRRGRMRKGRKGWRMWLF
jgi:hypothetical protein